MKKRSVLLIVLLLTLLLACRFTTPSPTPTLAPPTPTDTPLPPSPTATLPAASDTPTITDTATLPPSATVDPNAIPHLAPGSDVIITEIQMFSTTTGWAIGGELDPGDHVLRTTDGGGTWTDLTPPEPAPASGDKTATAFFLDADTAWVIYSGPDIFTIPDPPRVWYTSNAGATWNSGALDASGLDETFSPAFFSFPDSSHGWLMVVVGAGMSHRYIAIFRTTDGGASWDRIVDPFITEDLHVCDKTGMVFANADVGWITRDCFGVIDGTHVITTSDGGVTWSLIELPPPASDPSALDFPKACLSHSPHLFTAQSGLLGVNCRDYVDGETVETNFFYTTQDGGLTWAVSDSPGGNLFFLDPTTGWALSRDLYRYNSATNSWDFIRTVFWDGQFSFVNTMYAWAVARNEGEIALVMTTDGGVTWSELSPTIAP